jgi:hypothetical protein
MQNSYLEVKGKGKIVPVLNYLSTTPWRRVGEYVGLYLLRGTI